MFAIQTDDYFFESRTTTRGKTSDRTLSQLGNRMDQFEIGKALRDKPNLFANEKAVLEDKIAARHAEWMTELNHGMLSLGRSI